MSAGKGTLVLSGLVITLCLTGAPTVASGSPTATPPPVTTTAPNSSSPPWWETATPPVYSTTDPPLPMQVVDEPSSQEASYWSTLGGPPVAGEYDLSLGNTSTVTTSVVEFDLAALDLETTFVDALVLEGSSPGVRIDFDRGHLSVPRPATGYDDGGEVELQLALLGADGHLYRAVVEARFWATTDEAAPVPLVASAAAPTPQSAEVSPSAIAATEGAAVEAGVPDPSLRSDTGAKATDSFWTFVWDLTHPVVLFLLVMAAAFIYLKRARRRDVYDNQGNALVTDEKSAAAS